MRHETRVSMKVIVSAVRHAVNQGAMSGPGSELVLLAAAGAMEREAFAEFTSVELLEGMASVFEAVRETYLVPSPGGPSEYPSQPNTMALSSAPRLANGIGDSVEFWTDARRTGIASGPRCH